MKYRKDLDKMGAAMKKVRNPREWTPPGQETTPQQKKQISMQRSEGVKHGLDKESFKRDYKKATTSWDYRMANLPEEHKWAIERHNAGYGGIEMTGHPGEYLMGGGAIGGFKLGKSIMGKAIEQGTKYLAKNQYKIGANLID